LSLAFFAAPCLLQRVTFSYEAGGLRDDKKQLREDVLIILNSVRRLVTSGYTMKDVNATTKLFLSSTA